MKLAARILLTTLLLSSFVAFAADEDGDPAPRFHARTTSGETFNNENTKGKVVLFEFWTTWCQYCHQEESLIEQINKEFADKGLIVLAVDVAERSTSINIRAHAALCSLKTRISRPCIRRIPIPST